MAGRKSLPVLILAGYSVSHDGNCYVLRKSGDTQGKANTYHTTVDGAIIRLFERLLPERIAQRPEYHATMTELLEVVRQIRDEIATALGQPGRARDGGGKQNSGETGSIMGEPSISQPGTCGAQQNAVAIPRGCAT